MTDAAVDPVAYGEALHAGADGVNVARDVGAHDAVPR